MAFRSIDHADEVLGESVRDISTLDRARIKDWQQTDRSFELVQLLYREPAAFDTLDASVRTRAATVDDALTRSMRPLPRSIVVYRGIRSLEATFGTTDPGHLVGRQGVLDGYTATSVTRVAAQLDFTAVDGALLRVSVPAGYPALWVAGAGDSKLRKQGELLLPHGVRYRVTEVGVDGGMPVVFVEVL